MIGIDILIVAAPYVFVALAAISCATAALIGGWEGRWTTLLYILALSATRMADHYYPTWGRPNVAVGAVDAALLCGFYVVALCSQRYWPLWLAGLQLVTVIAHISALLAPAYFYRAYFVMAVAWSIPKMVVLLIGVLQDWRADHDRRAGVAAAKPR